MIGYCLRVQSCAEDVKRDLKDLFDLTYHQAKANAQSTADHGWQGNGAKLKETKNLLVQDLTPATLSSPDSLQVMCSHFIEYFGELAIAGYGLSSQEKSLVIDSVKADVRKEARTLAESLEDLPQFMRECWIQIRREADSRQKAMDERETRQALVRNSASVAQMVQERSTRNSGWAMNRRAGEHLDMGLR